MNTVEIQLYRLSQQKGFISKKHSQITHSTSSVLLRYKNNLQICMNIFLYKTVIKCMFFFSDYVKHFFSPLDKEYFQLGACQKCHIFMYSSPFQSALGNISNARLAQLKKDFWSQVTFYHHFSVQQRQMNSVLSQTDTTIFPLRMESMLTPHRLRFSRFCGRAL